MGELLKPGMFVAVDDLDSGYWHLALHPKSYQYCGNSCVDPKTGKTHYFQWKVLFLGITSAVTVFTQIVKPIKVYLWLKCGLIILIYIDDLMVAATGVNILPNEWPQKDGKNYCPWEELLKIFI